MEYRNPKYNQLGTVDCEINHPDYGWIPFTANPDDVEQLGRDLYAQIIAAGNIAPADPPPVINITTITKLQFIEWCEANNKLTDLQNLLNSDATLMFKWNAASYLDITNPLVTGAATALGLVAQDVFNEIG